jgi:hypothetical protein
MDVFNVGKIRKYIYYGTLLGGMMVFVSPLSNVSHSQMLTLNNNLENRSFDGSLVGIWKAHVGFTSNVMPPSKSKPTSDICGL